MEFGNALIEGCLRVIVHKLYNLRVYLLGSPLNLRQLLPNQCKKPTKQLQHTLGYVSFLNQRHQSLLFPFLPLLNFLPTGRRRRRRRRLPALHPTKLLQRYLLIIEKLHNKNLELEF